MPRPRDQRGTLTRRTSRGQEWWWGRFRVYRGNKKQEERRTQLGRVSEMSEEEARAKLVDLIGRMNRRCASIKDFSPETVLKSEIEFSGLATRYLTGTISELVVASDLMARGYEVFRGLCAQSSCDLISLKDGVTQRIEVKTENPQCSYELRRNVGKFDTLALYSKETGKIRYLSAMNLHELKPRKINRKVRVNPAENLVSGVE